MIRTLLVLALAGCVLSAGPLSPQVQEKWKFVGKVMAGVSNPRQAFAGTELDIDMTVDRKEDNSIDVNFVKVVSKEFAKVMTIGYPSEETHGDNGSRGKELRVAELEGTFTAFLDRDQGAVMEVPAGSLSWTNNIRKAIVGMLRVPPYVGDRQLVDLERNAFSREHSSRNAEERISFKKRENIFAGICNISYTISPDSTDGRFPGSPDDVLPADGKYFRMIRSIDYDSCVDVVNFQKTSMGNFSTSYKNQMKEVMERSTVAEYVMQKKSDGSFQLKGIIQNGDTIVRPFGQDTGRTIVHVNQTMALQSISQGGRKLESPLQSANTDQVTTWLYQFTSPATADPDTKVDWVIFQGKPSEKAFYPEYAVVGTDGTSQQDLLQDTKATLESVTQLQQEKVSDFQLPFNGTSNGHLTHLLKVLARSIGALDREHVKTLFDETDKNGSPSDRIRRQSFLDAVAASGSSQAILELLDAAKANKVPEARMGGIMPLLTNSVMDPHAVKQLMDYVMALSQTNKYLEMMAHLNFAELARRVCFDEQVRNYSVPQAILGNRRCDRNAIENSFVPHMKSKIESASETWRKLMYIQTLGNLGLESTIPYLCDISSGRSPISASSPTIRQGATYSLSQNFHREEKREKVMRELLPVVESHSEDFEIRETAFLAIMYMKPNATILQRFALNTWRDPSSQMRSLVSSAIISLAQSDDPDFKHMRVEARKALPLIRMTQPSLQNAFFFDYQTRLPHFKIDVGMKFAWASSHKSMLNAPRQFLADLEASFGGVVTPIIRVYSMMSFGLTNSDESSGNVRDAHQKKIHQELAELASDLELEERKGSTETYLYASGFNYQGFVSNNMFDLRQRVMQSLANAAGKPSAIAYPDQMVKFFNLVDNIIMLPTPFGTPAICEISVPINWLSDNTELVRKREDGSYNITVEGISKMIMKTQSFVKVIMPWHNKTAVAGIDTEHSLNTPGKMSTLIGGVYPYPLLKLVISPVFHGEIPMVYSRNKPFSALRSMRPTADLSSTTTLVSPTSPHEGRYKRYYDIPPSYLGLKARVTFDGDVDYPYIQSHVLSFVEKPERLITLFTSQTEKEYSLAFRLNIDESETKNISMAALIRMKDNSLPSRVPLRGSLEKVGQHMAEELSIRDSMEEQLSKARAGEFGDFIVALGVNYTAPGKEDRRFEIALCGTNKTQPSPDKYEQSVVLNIMSMGQKERPEQNKMCFVSSITEKLRPSDSNRESQLYTTAEVDVYAGKSCSSDEKVARAEARFHLSNDDRDIVPHHRHPLTSNSDGLFTGPSGRAPVIVDAIYDRINMQFQYLGEPPLSLQNFTYRARDLMRGYMFPHVISNRLPSQKGSENRLIVNLTRNVAADTMDAWLHYPDETVFIDQLNTMPIFDWASPLLGPHQRYHHHEHVPNSPQRSLRSAGAARCEIDAEKVKTFDELEFEKTPTTCWAVATQLHHEQESFAVMFKQVEASPQSEVEVQIMLPSVAKIEILKGQEVKVNGEVVTGSKELKDTSGKTIGTVNTTSDSIIVSVPSKLEVILQNTNQLTVKIADKYSRLLKGLCGDFDGEQHADMRSAKGCAYIPAMGKVYAASWVANKAVCSDPSIQRYIEEAKQAEQGRCKKAARSTR